ncbi:hypothetical protein HPB47_006007 [Ixodes persulcatus]|uniref:Uncharacterized protein n=1 Tax=Ixodes persulcatus TaxID=34615 RepID=A0AC60PBB2_IXOPE|nr:hypothetical protein HPB47_006007 [Ixodes persulcatus]
MTMQVTVEGEDISPEEFQCAGWQSAFTKRKSSQKCLPAESEQPTDTPSGSSNGGSRTPASVKKRLVAASRMPRLPKEHFRVIVRPRGGINVKNVSQVKIAQALVTAAGLSFTNAAEDIICPNAVQNILVVSTPSEHNAKTYARVEAISIGSAIYEVSSYLAAPDNTCKGIIRNIDLELDHEQLRSLIVQPRNPKALEARRIKNSTTVVILFDGLKVPNYVMCGLSMLRCTLYRRQTEVCYACGRLGHRADVCPTPENVVCRGCGVNSPSDQHVCSPKCALCGGPHPTADKSCKQRYQVPYIVRQRRKERRDYNQDFPPMGPLSRPAVPPRAGSPKPEREETSMEVPVEAPSEARTAKKRALTNPVRDEGPDEFQTEMRVLLKSLSEAVAMLNDKVDALDGKFNALEARASTERLMQLGVHNTLEEIIEAQETAQVARLSSSPAGRKILAVLGLNPTLVAERRHQLSDAQRASIQTSPFLLVTFIHSTMSAGAQPGPSRFSDTLGTNLARLASWMPHSMATRPVSGAGHCGAHVTPTARCPSAQGGCCSVAPRGSSRPTGLARGPGSAVGLIHVGVAHTRCHRRPPPVGPPPFFSLGQRARAAKRSPRAVHLEPPGSSTV